MPRKEETTEEFQRREFPGRVKAVRKRAREALKADKAVGKGQKRLSVEQRGKHQAALRAANRVAERMGIGSQKKESVQATPRPDKVAKGGAAGRRRIIEKATGVGPAITDPLRKLEELARAAKAKRKGN